MTLLPLKLNASLKYLVPILSILSILIILYIAWYFSVSKATLFVLNSLQFESEPSDALICAIDLLVTLVVESLALCLAYSLFIKYELVTTAVFIGTFMLWLILTRYPNGDEWPWWYTPSLALEFLLVPLALRLVFKKLIEKPLT